MKKIALIIALAFPMSAHANPIHNSHWHWRNPGIVTINPGKKPGRIYKPAIARPSPINYMAQLAPKWWGANACEGNYQIQYADSYPGDLPGMFSAVAFSSWTTSQGLQNTPGITEGNTDCTITFVNEFYANFNMMYADWPTFCGVFLHEYGHLLGYEHTDQIGNVMYPVMMSKEIPAACVTDPTGHVWSDYLTDAHAIHS